MGIKKKMTVGIYDPYLGAVLGGGERYVFTLAECLIKNGHQVDIFWEAGELPKLAKERLKIDLTGVNFAGNIFGASLFKRWWATRKYEVIFYLSDGSLPLLFAKRNFIHMQVPLTGVRGRSLRNILKKFLIKDFICNSEFTKKVIDRVYGVSSLVLYPPVAVEDFRNDAVKENIILGVGRFTQALHAKKQEVLVINFKELVDQGLKDWQLVLIGGALPADASYLGELKRSATGYPISIETNISFSELKEYYARAKIFWHATGFGENEEQHPERMEHFGIVVVEAMASACVPVVIDKGGLKEIVSQNKDGFLWETEEELKKMTLQLIESPQTREKMALQSIKASQKFSKEEFCQRVDEIIGN